VYTCKAVHLLGGTGREGLKILQSQEQEPNERGRLIPDREHKKRGRFISVATVVGMLRPDTCYVV
jgi:hypothetical protein